MKNAKNRREAFFDGVWMDTLRGDHSTGICAVPIGEETKEPIVWKKALNGPDFLSLGRTASIIGDIEKYSILMAHNRAATNGNLINQNAHPFQFEHITLAHNGHINNAWPLVPTGKSCHVNVDSAQVAFAMAYGDEKDILERCQGNFAFTWHNAKDGTLNFARNSGRPLKFCYTKGENTMWWMSERTMLVSVLDRNEVEIEGPFFNLPEHQWLKFKVGNLREYETIPFVPRSSSVTRSTAGTGGVSTGNNSAATGSTKATNSGGYKSQAWLHGARLAGAQEKLIDSLLKTITKPSKDEMEKREYELKKNSSRPTGRKVKKTAERLATTGFGYDQLVVVDLRQFKEYVNQKALGHACGTLFNTEVATHLSAITLSQYAEYKKLDVLLGRIINLKPTETESQALIIEPHPLAKEFDVVWRKRWDALAKKNETDRATRRALPPPVIQDHPLLPNVKQYGVAGPPSSTDVGSDGDDSRSYLTHSGPGGTTVSSQRYMELVKLGCAECTGDLPIDPVGSKRVVWIDTAPFCIDCAARSHAETTAFKQKGILH
jgi:hypothetical protein